MQRHEIEYLNKCRREDTRAARQMIQDKAFDLLAIVNQLLEENEHLRKNGAR